VEEKQHGSVVFGIPSLDDYAAFEARGFHNIGLEVRLAISLAVRGSSAFSGPGSLRKRTLKTPLSQSLASSW
jgi:hypothetical protein